MKPMIIESGINEGTTKLENPTVPYSADECADTILAVAAAGASIVHWHARNSETGANMLNEPEPYRHAMAKVRAQGCDVHMYPTYPPYVDDIAVRFQHVREIASDPDLGFRIGPLDMGTINLIRLIDGQFTDSSYLPMEASVYKNLFLDLKTMLAWFVEMDLVPTLAVFEPGHLRTIAGFMDAGALARRPIVKIFFSEDWVYGTLPDREGLDCYLHMMDRLGILDEVEWMVVPTSIRTPGAVQDLIDAAIDLGGHVRTGVGDLPTFSEGRSNAEMITEVADLARAVGRPIATPAQVVELCTR